MFYVWAGIYTFGAVIFAALAEGEVQDWADGADTLDTATKV